MDNTETTSLAHQQNSAAPRASKPPLSLAVTSIGLGIPITAVCRLAHTRSARQAALALASAGDKTG